MFLQKMVQLSNEAFLWANKKEGLKEGWILVLHVKSKPGFAAPAPELLGEKKKDKKIPNPLLGFFGWKWREGSACSDRKRTGNWKGFGESISLKNVVLDVALLFC